MALVLMRTCSDSMRTLTPSCELRALPATVPSAATKAAKFCSVPMEAAGRVTGGVDKVKPLFRLGLTALDPSGIRPFHDDSCDTDIGREAT